jgi:hypothetical protein
MSEFRELNGCVFRKQEAQVQRRWSRGFILDHRHREAGASAELALAQGGTQGFVCQPCDALLRLRNGEELERRIYDGCLTFPEMDQDDPENLEWLGRHRRAFVAAAVDSLDPTVSPPGSIGLNREQRRAMDWQMAKRP